MKLTDEQKLTFKLEVTKAVVRANLIKGAVYLRHGNDIFRFYEVATKRMALVPITTFLDGTDPLLMDVFRQITVDHAAMLTQHIEDKKVAFDERKGVMEQLQSLMSKAAKDLDDKQKKLRSTINHARELEVLSIDDTWYDENVTNTDGHISTNDIKWHLNDDFSSLLNSSLTFIHVFKAQKSPSDFAATMLADLEFAPIQEAAILNTGLVNQYYHLDGYIAWCVENILENALTIQANHDLVTSLRSIPTVTNDEYMGVALEALVKLARAEKDNEIIDIPSTIFEAIVHKVLDFESDIRYHFNSRLPLTWVVDRKDLTNSKYFKFNFAGIEVMDAPNGAKVINSREELPTNCDEIYIYPENETGHLFQYKLERLKSVTNFILDEFMVEGYEQSPHNYLKPECMISGKEAPDFRLAYSEAERSYYLIPVENPAMNLCMDIRNGKFSGTQNRQGSLVETYGIPPTGLFLPLGKKVGIVAVRGDEKEHFFLEPKLS
tara:strand:- start:206363 stop:207838 length:1476 start_codon:yes stop_codon:yes gene_type:complete